MPVANQVGWQTVDETSLQVLANRHFRAREVGNVAFGIHVREILRAEIKKLQTVFEIVEISREIEGTERIKFAGRAETGVLNA